MEQSASPAATAIMEGCYVTVNAGKKARGAGVAVMQRDKAPSRAPASGEREGLISSVRSSTCESLESENVDRPTGSQPGSSKTRCNAGKKIALDEYMLVPRLKCSLGLRANA